MDIVSTLRAQWLEAEKDKIEAEISRMTDLRNYYQNMAELSHDDNAENYIRQANLVDRWIDELKIKKDNLSLSVPSGWIDYDVTPTPKEMPDIDINKIDEIPF